MVFSTSLMAPAPTTVAEVPGIGEQLLCIIVIIHICVCCNLHRQEYNSYYFYTVAQCVRLSDMAIITGFYHQYITVLMRLSVAHPSFCWNTGKAITGCPK